MAYRQLGDRHRPEGRLDRALNVAEVSLRVQFEEVRKTVEEIGSQLSTAWDRVKPSEAVVEFGLTLTAKSGKLTGLIVDGEGECSLKVTLTWSGDRPSQP